MRLSLHAGIGDEIALTAAVREYKKQYPDEMILVEDLAYPAIFQRNPWIQIGNADNGATVKLQVHKNEKLGSIPHSFARQIAIATKKPFALIDDTPEVHLTLDELSRGAVALPSVQGPYIAIDVGAMWPSRRWPTERWDALVAKLRDFATVIQIGGDNVDAFNQPSSFAVRETTRFRGTVRETLALLHACDLYIGNDSGSFHMAAAVGCPQVTIFGPKRWYARAYWNTTPVFDYDDCHVDCEQDCRRLKMVPAPERESKEKPVLDHCLEHIGVDRVLDAARVALRRYRGEVVLT